jgi:subtilisin family serine protease
MAPVAVALAASWIALGSGPALADQVRQSEWWLHELHITTAQRISDGSGVTIAVLDTGVDAAAPDLGGSVLTGPDFTHSGRTAGGPFFGINGTEVASIIAGHGHGPGDSEGIMGVSPAAKILSVRVTLDGGDPLLADPAVTAGLPASIAEGIRYATDNGASVIDLPMDPGAASATGTPGVPGLAAGSAAEKSAVAYALSKGVVLVAPAGDDGTGGGIVNYPAAYPGVISVGAFDQDFTKAPFSSHQPYVTLTAAGEGVTAATPTGYATVNSTSAASAVVTGIVAMIRSEFPALTPAQVTKSLTSSTRFRRPGGALIGSGYGTADAAAALKAAAAMAEPHGQRAGTGSVARVAPATPAAHPAKPGLSRRLRRDGAVSLALLVVLLAAVTVFALLRRHRARTEVSDFDGGGWPETPAFATAGAGLAEQVEFLPSPPSGAGSREPGRDVGIAAGVGPSSAAAAFAGAASFAGSRAFTGSRTFTGSSAGGMAVAGGYPDLGGPAEPPLPPGTSGLPGRGQRPAERAVLAPVPRAAHGRARVSGSPPWEPAAKPGSELPWAAMPALQPDAPSEAARRRVPSAGSLWDASVADDLTETPAPAAGGGPEPDSTDVWRASEADSEPADGATYAWNPAETTETFPTVPAGDEA